MRKLKYLLYPFEALFFAFVVFLGWIVPFQWASALGGFLGRSLGPRLGRVNSIARRNMDLAALSLSPPEKDLILEGMWDNLGRTFLEYVRLPNQTTFGPNSRFDIEGLEHLDALIHDNNPGLLFSAHYGNWEVGTYIAQKRGLVTAQVTRFLNNPLTRFLVNKVHGRVARKIIPKGAEGAKEILRELRAGHHVSLLADQKMNDGIAVPFFGRSAMTAPALAKIALKFNCPLVPFYVIRLPHARFKVIFEAPLQPAPQASDPVHDLTSQMNAHIESWIRAHPEQWFWVHRRFDKELYR